jgi:hypothetical protein
VVPRHGRETVGRGRGRCAGQVLPPYQSSLAVGACHHAATFRQESATGARALISRSVWLMLPRRSCSAGWVSAMSFADKMKQLLRVPRRGNGLYSDALGRPLRAVHFPSRPRGNPPHDDGSSVFVDVDALRTTANHHLIRQGLAYPTYYRALFQDLRNEFTAAGHRCGQAGPRRRARGVGQ